MIGHVAHPKLEATGVVPDTAEVAVSTTLKPARAGVALYAAPSDPVIVTQAHCHRGGHFRGEAFQRGSISQGRIGRQRGYDALYELAFY